MSEDASERDNPVPPLDQVQDQVQDLRLDPRSLTVRDQLASRGIDDERIENVSHAPP